jgi:hypothetical protein
MRLDELRSPARRLGRTRLRLEGFHDGASTSSNVGAEPAQTRRVLDEHRRRPHVDAGARTLAGAMERDRGSGATCGPRRVGIFASHRPLEGFWRRDEQSRMVVRDLDARGRPCRRHREDRGFGDRSRTDGTSGVRRQGARHARPYF